MATALVVVTPAAFLGPSVAADQQPDTSRELATVERMLRDAGATPATLIRIEESLRDATPVDVAGFETYVRDQQADALARMIEGMRYDDRYLLGPDSRQQPGVPQGKIFEFTLDHSRIFPGSTHKVTVYVPAQYSADNLACVYVGLDELAFKATTVFDNLIARNEMPVTIAIGLAPGVVSSANTPQEPRFNRSLEFDALSDHLARFLLEEVFPQVEDRKSPDGLLIRLSTDPNDRAVGGVSTGGIGSFTLAWERPDAFRRVFTASGTFVGMRGGDRYPVVVRKTEPKPLRIFIQDGSHDELDDIVGEVGDWWMANQTMKRALEFAGYQVQHIWGEGPHASEQATVVFPDAMRWLWKDWPAPVTAGKSKNVFLNEILQPEDGWHRVPGDYQSAGVLTADPAGAIVFYDPRVGKARKLFADGRLGDYAMVGKAYGGVAYGPDGRVYASQADKIIAYAPDGRFSTLAIGIQSQQFIVTYDGKLYLTESGTGKDAGKVWLIQPTGEKTLLDTGLSHPSGIAISPDGLWLAVAESKTHWGYSYRVQENGSIQAKQRFYWFHVPDTADDSGAGPWVMDREGRLYSATRMGIQVFDRNGRSRAILPLPGGEVTGLAFGGANFRTLYVSCRDHSLYRRNVKVPGAQPWSAPIKLPAWSAG